MEVDTISPEAVAAGVGRDPSHQTTSGTPAGSIAARVSAAVAILGSVVVLVGWLTDTPTLTTVVPSLASMKVNTAVGFLLSGASLWLLAGRNPGFGALAVARACAAVVMAIGAMFILEYLFSLDLGLDQLFLPDRYSDPASFPGRPGLNTAIAFTLLGTGLATRRIRRRWLGWLSDGSLTAAALTALIAAVGYLYSFVSGTGLVSHTEMALHTTLLFLLLGVAAQAAPPIGPGWELWLSRGPGGMMMRRLLPAFGAVLVVTGWFRLWGQEQGWFGPELGAALLIVTSLAGFLIATGAVARLLDRATARSEAARLELVERERRYRSIVDAAFSGLIVSEQGVIREANVGAARMWGYEPDAVVGRQLIEFLDSHTAAEVLERARRGEDGAYEGIGRRSDGTTFPFESVVRLHRQGARILRVAAIRDLTSQRKLEQQFRQAQRTEAIGRLAGGLAHDFNNVLSVVLAHAEFLLDAPARSDAERGDILAIRDAALGAANLTRQLLAFSRQQVLEPSVISVNDVVSGVERMVRRVIGSDIIMRLVLEEEVRPVLADRGQLEQVLMNLVVNARDAMPDGGVLTLETANVRRSPSDLGGQSSDAAQPHVMLAVSDTGVGMSDTVRERLFEPFFTTKSPDKGTGLGLASVYGIVKQSGGDILVYSEPGEGSTFKVYFPAVDQAVHPEPTPDAPPDRLDGRETVLLAEDSAALRGVIRTALVRHGYTVIEAADGIEALHRAEAQAGSIDLLITDMIMPGLKGRELARRLRAVQPDLPVLFISGYTDDVMMQQTPRDPRTRFLAKPFTPEAIVRKVRQVLDGSRR